MQCCICFSDYNETTNKPLILPCGHDFCLTCLSDLYKHDNERFIECPNCRQKHKTRPDSLPVVYSLLASSTTSAICSVSGCQVKSYKFCQHCNRSLCQRHHDEDLVTIKQLAVTSLQTANQIAGDCSSRLKVVQSEIVKIHSQYEEFRVNMDSMMNNLKLKDAAVQQLKDSTLSSLHQEEAELKRRRSDLEDPAVALEEKLNSDNDLVPLYKQLEPLLRPVPKPSPAFRIQAEWGPIRGDLSQLLTRIRANAEVAPTDPLKGHRPSEVSGEVRDERLRGPGVNRKLDYSPLALAVCRDSRGFKIGADGRMEKGSGILQNIGTQLPPVFLFISLWEDDERLLVVSESSETLGFVKLELGIEEPSLQGLACAQRRLYISDIDNSCVHVTDLAGKALVTAIGGPKMFSDVRGLCVDERAQQLLVCDAEKKQIFIFNIDDLSLILTISDPSFKQPQAVSVCPVTGEIWVLDFEGSRLHVIDGDTKRRARVIGDLQLSFPWGIVHSISGLIYVTSQHCVLQITDSGFKKASVGHHGKAGAGDNDFNVPCGIALVNHRDKSFVFVSDKNNRRLKTFTL